MRVITETSTGLAKYVFGNDTNISATATEIIVSESADGEDVVKFIIADLNSTLVTVTDNVTNVPDDWIGNKYLFDGITWTLSPDWVEPPA